MNWNTGGFHPAPVDPEAEVLASDGPRNKLETQTRAATASATAGSLKATTAPLASWPRDMRFVLQQLISDSPFNGVIGSEPGDLSALPLPVFGFDTLFHRGKEIGENGIGLSTARKIARICGGDILAYDNNGACFEVILKDYS